MNLNTPTIDAGPLTVADLDAARQHSRGRIAFDPGAIISDDDAERVWRNSCAPEGGAHRDPAPAFESMLRHRRNLASIKGGFCLALLLAVVGYVVRAVYPL